MDNQHRKISGYRELSQAEIDLMNRIKAAGQQLLALQAELSAKLAADAAEKSRASGVSQARAGGEPSAEMVEWRRFAAAEPQRWASIGKTEIQQGVMALVRAVAQPAE